MSYPLIERNSPAEVADGEIDIAYELTVAHLEVEPVCVPTCVSIYSHEKLELTRTLLNHCVQVAALEVRTELQKPLSQLPFSILSQISLRALLRICIRPVAVEGIRVMPAWTYLVGYLPM